MKKLFTFLLLCIATSVGAQQAGLISGSVTSEADGSPLVGAVVSVEGTNAYTTTDQGGGYTISAQRGSVLNFQLLGYKNQSVTVGASAIVDVALAQDATLIDDLVVVGYGVQKKSLVTGAISSVQADDLTNLTPTRMESMLQGKISGVNITRNSGQPSDGVTVRIRGIGSATDNGNASNPLYVIDGMQMGSDDGLNQLNPSDIASIEVLKDAASAAIYGSKGANGVIIVTTKKGVMGDARVNYDMQYGWQNAWKMRPMLNSFEFQTLMNEAALNSGMAAPYADASAYDYDTNWQKEVFNKNAPVQNHQVSVSGASDRVNYYVSLGYFKQEGIVGGNYGKSNFDRISLRTNSTYKLMDKSADRNFLAKANLGVSAQYAHQNDTGIGTNQIAGGQLTNALMAPPNESVYLDTQEEIDSYLLAAASYDPTLPIFDDGNGNYFNPFEVGEVRNPVADMYTNTQKNWADKFFGSFWADLELYKGLTFRSSYGVDMAFWGNNSWSRPYYRSALDHPITSSASAQFNRGFTYQFENTLTYQETFAEKHSVTVLLGQSARSNKNSTSLEGNRQDLKTLDLDMAYLNHATALQGNVWGGPVNPYRLASYFGRLGYNYDERYMLEVTVRKDGSSRFGANNKWGTFPSASLGWNIHNEAFAENRPEWIETLKLRASWGQNGNDNIGDFQYTSNIGQGNLDRYLWGNARDLSIYQLGAVPGRLANPDLKWEASEQIDLGLDASLFDGALTFSLDWFKKTTKGMLIGMQLPSYVGNSLPMANAGDMSNTGFEFEVDYRFHAGDWDFGVMANATYLKNTLDNIGNSNGFDNVNFNNDAWGPGTFRRDENGKPFHHFWGKKTDGVFQTWNEVNSYVNSNGDLIQPNAAPGDVRFRDLNGDGKISDDDKTMIGNYFPAWTYNFTFDAAWKGIDFSMFWQGVANVDIFDFSLRTDRTGFNLPAWQLDRWTGPGSSNKLPRVLAKETTNGNLTSSDLYIQNGAYLRLRSLQIGYTVPERWTNKALISRLRVYFQAENLLTITGYRGFDPEINGGVDAGMYPQARTLSVGVNLGF